MRRSIYLALPLMAVGWAVGCLLTALGQDGQLVMAFVLGGVLFVIAGKVLPLLPMIVLCMSMAGGVVGTMSIVGTSDDACHISRHVTRRGQQMGVVGRVVGAGERLRSSWRFLVRAESVGTTNRKAVCGHIELYRPVDAEALHDGELIWFRARLKPAVGTRNPGVPSARLRRLSEDIGAVAYVPSGEVLVVRPPRRPGVLSRLRRELSRRIDAVVVDDEERALVLALVTGERRQVSQQQQSRFSRAGLSHLLAVSGLHLALVAMGVFGLLRWLLRRCGWLTARGDPRRFAACAAALVAVAYTITTGAGASTIRACTMSCALFLSLVVGRSTDLVRPLSLAALLLLVHDPLNLFRPKFQLSFAAVVGIALILRRQRFTERPQARRSISSRLARGVFGLASITLGATLLTAPLVAHHFGVVSVVGLAANLVGVPLVSFFLLPAALVGALLSSLSLTMVGDLLLRLAGELAGVLDALCATIAAQPTAALQVQVSWPIACGLLALGVAVLMEPSRLRRAMLLGGAVIVLTVAVRQWVKTPALEAVFLDVGQGDATFVQLPDGGTMLVDAGGRRRGGDPGQRCVVPFLRRRGVERLDIVVVTHPHADHVGGLRAVFDSVQVGELWICWHDEPDSWVRAARQWAANKGVTVRRPRVLRQGGVVVRPIWPTPAGNNCGDPTRSANDNSIVLHLEHGGRSLLLGGDIEKPAELALVASGATMRADVIKVPHHGSRGSSSPSFLASVRPRVAVISAGVANRFGLPHAETLRRYARVGAQVVRTDDLGAIRVRLFADGTMSWEAVTALIP